MSNIFDDFSTEESFEEMDEKSFIDELNDFLFGGIENELDEIGE